MVVTVCCFSVKDYNFKICGGQVHVLTFGNSIYKGQHEVCILKSLVDPLTCENVEKTPLPFGPAFVTSITND